MTCPLPEKAQKVNGIKLTDWIVDPDYGYCALRAIEGTDIREIKNRVAFIEKTPRVRVTPYDESLPEGEDFRKWHCGYKGDDGFDEISRGWADARLQEMGFDVPNPVPFNEADYQ